MTTNLDLEETAIYSKLRSSHWHRRGEIRMINICEQTTRPEGYRYIIRLQNGTQLKESEKGWQMTLGIWRLMYKELVVIYLSLQSTRRAVLRA